ncbi:MAG TPA: YesL family protein [Epulopiscium sp.]|nr:YesL family protein [Candidatus Epulonipiscium sp.]
MNSFFNLEGPFYKWGTEIADVMILSLLWLVCSLPIVTIGASTTALFYVYGKKVRKEDPYIVKSFFESFKQNFKQATLLTLMMGVIFMSEYLYFEILRSGQGPAWVKIIGLFFMIQATFITLYIFPVLSRFEMTIKNIVISSFIFANKHFITSIICTILFLISVFAVVSLTPFAIFAFGIYALLSSFLFQRIFTKSIEAVAAEKEKENEEEATEEIEEEIEEI